MQPIPQGDRPNRMYLQLATHDLHGTMLARVRPCAYIESELRLAL